ncbi:hypothetical protein [Magnetococcus sp. PR-3]|uniref:hypothetical protein n=1 Tax=Magnetococcus sp. PR-3 TaxID=3120355 RepID=UPI002FCDF398
MMLQPSILALTIADGVALLFLLLASGFAVILLRHWNLGSGSAQQLTLERQTYLVSTLLSFALVTQLITLLLLVFNADRMAEYFVGAMCAVGTFNAHPWGFPALQLRLLLFVMAGVWLVMNHLDNQHPRYPLIRPKYALVLAITLLCLSTAGVQLGYFLGLEGDLSAVITSCCGALFSVDAPTLAADLSGMDPRMLMMLLTLTLAATIAAGLLVIKRGKGYGLFGGLTLLSFLVSMASIIGFLSLYIYEHPHHHCPFCFLKADYHYLGYLLYIPLLTATTLGLGVSASSALNRSGLLNGVLHNRGITLIRLATYLWVLFALLTLLLVNQSNLILLES